VIEPTLISQDGWTMRVRPGNNQRLWVLLHGWSGSEDVMWIFTRRLAPDDWMISPRGPIHSPEGGFGWFPTGTDLLPSLTEIKPAIEQVLTAIDHWAHLNSLDAKQIALMGFSQGTLLAYAIMLLFPQRVLGLAALAGYLPEKWEDAENISALAGKPIYIAHGTQDTTIPISSARHTVQFLERIGANITYCESETGHKLSMGCLHGLEDFSRNLPAPDQGNKRQKDT
jgi:phospholipase/carboxylesterase